MENELWPTAGYFDNERFEPREQGENMPWKAVKSSGPGWDIVVIATGKVVGHSDNKEDAEASVRARFAAEAKK